MAKIRHIAISRTTPASLPNSMPMSRDEDHGKSKKARCGWTDGYMDIALLPRRHELSAPRRASLSASPSTRTRARRL